MNMTAGHSGFEDVYIQSEEQDIAIQANFVGLRLGSRGGDNTAIDEDSDEDLEIAGYVNAVGTRSSQDADAGKRRRENGIASTRSRQAGQYVAPRVEDLVDDDVMMDRMPEETQSSSQT